MSGSRAATTPPTTPTSTSGRSCWTRSGSAGPSTLGQDDYDLPGYFGAERWTYERLKTSGQNTLMLDGANQDPQATAPLTAFRTSTDGGFAIADLTAAYAASGATRVQRGVSLRDNRYAGADPGRGRDVAAGRPDLDDAHPGRRRGARADGPR